MGGVAAWNDDNNRETHWIMILERTTEDAYDLTAINHLETAIYLGPKLLETTIEKQLVNPWEEVIITVVCAGREP